MSSGDHWETMKAYKEMDRQDREAARTGTTPEYVRTGVVSTGSSGSNNSNTQSNNSNTNSNSQSSNRAN